MRSEGMPGKQTPGLFCRLRAIVITTKPSNPHSTALILIACLVGVVMAVLVSSRLYIFGSEPGGWVYEYRSPTSVPLWIPLAVLSLLAVSAFMGSRLIVLHEKKTLLGCLLAAILAQFLIYDVYPVPLEVVVQSDEANGFYSVAMHYSPVEALAQYRALLSSFPLHVGGNMPGKILLFQLLRTFTSSPRIMGYSVMLLSTFGALLIYGISKRLFHDRLAAFYAFMLYALIPGRLFFFPILNAVAPLFMLLCLYLFLVYIDRKNVVWLWLMGCALYAMVLFEPSPLATGLIFIAILLIALREKRLSAKDVGRLLLHPLLAFLCLYVAFFVLFGFELVGALRSVLREAASFNIEDNRGYWQWVGGNTREFLYAAGTPIMIIVMYWTARILWQWRAPSSDAAHSSMDTAFVLALMATFTALLFLGINRGETSRLWIYLAVLFSIPAALLIARTPRSPLLFYLVESTLMIQSVVALQRVDFVAPHDCQYENMPGFEIKTAALTTFAEELKRCAANGSGIGTLPQCMDLPRARRPLEVTFVPFLSLNSVAISGAAEAGGGNTFRGGDRVGVTTYWTPLEDTQPLKFSLRLLDSSERQWVQSDYWPQANWVPCRPSDPWRRGQTQANRQDIWLPPDLPPGRYEVSLVIYDSETEGALLADEKPSARLAEINVLGAAPPPELGPLAIPVRVDVPLSEEIALIGFGVEPNPLRPESDAMLRAWWAALRPPTQPYQVQIELINSDGRTVSSSLQPLSIAPPDTWQEGQIVGERYPITLDADAISGDYRLRVSLVTPGNATPAEPVEVGTVRVHARPREYDLPSIEHRLNIGLGREIALRGYSLDRSAEGVNELRLTLFWQALARVKGRYKVFVHLVDDSGRIVAQRDAEPQAGAAPTQSWLAGEVVADAHALTVPPGGPYRVLIGLYDPVSGQRLPVWDEAQQPVRDAAVPLEGVLVQ